MKISLKMGISLIIGLIVLIVLITATNSGSNNTARYSIYNTGADGLSLLFDGLTSLNNNNQKNSIESFHSKINTYTDVSNVQIVVEPYFFYYNDNDIKDMAEWVFYGGRIIFLQDGDVQNRNELVQYFNSQPEYSTDEYSLYRHGMGEALIGPSYGAVNSFLMNDRSVGYIITGMLQQWDWDYVYFNEHYHGYSERSNLWRELPGSVRYLVYQLVIIAAVLIIFYGGRFGKPIQYYEETEREENEYLLALANIYENAGMGEAAVEKYYNELINKCRQYFSIHEDFNNEDSSNDNSSSKEILRIWRDKKLSGAAELEELMLFSENREALNTHKAADKAKMIKLIKNVNKLNKILKN